MTQPDEFHPVTAANYDSFAGFANTTEEEWRSQIDGSLTGVNPLSGVCALMAQLPFMDGLAAYGGYGQDEDTGIASGMVNGVQLLADAFCGLISGSAGGFGGTTPSLMFDLFGKIFDLVFENPISKLFIQLVDETGDLAFDVLNGVMEFFGKILEILFGIFNPGKIIGIISEILDKLFGFFDSGDTSSGGLLGLVEAFLDWGGVIWDLIQGVLDAIANVFGGFTRVFDMFNGLFDFADGTDSGFGFIEDFGTNLFNGLIEFGERVAGTVEDVVEIFSAPIERLMGVPQEFIERTVGTASQYTERVVDAFEAGFNASFGDVREALDDLAFTLSPNRAQPTRRATSQTARHTADTAGSSAAAGTAGGRAAQTYREAAAATANIGASLNGFFRAVFF